MLHSLLTVQLYMKIIHYYNIELVFCFLPRICPKCSISGARRSTNVYVILSRRCDTIAQRWYKVFLNWCLSFYADQSVMVSDHVSQTCWQMHGLLCKNLVYLLNMYKPVYVEMLISSSRTSLICVYEQLHIRVFII